MKRYLLGGAILLASTLFFSACGATKGVEIADYRKDIKFAYQKGTIVASKKVIVSREQEALVQGVMIGGASGMVVGGISGHPIEGAIVGGVAGGVAGVSYGYIKNGNEDSVYQITIRKNDDLKDYYAFVAYDLELKTQVEFVTREDERPTNISILDEKGILDEKEY